MSLRTCARIRSTHAAAVAVVLLLAVAADSLADPGSDSGETAAQAVIEAAQLADAGRLAALLAAGASADTRTARGATALQAAAGAASDACVRLLVEHGATLDAPGDQNITALASAARQGNVQVVATLLDAGANIDAAATPERTAMALAAGHGQVAVVKLLLERGSHALDSKDTRKGVFASLVDAAPPELLSLLVSSIAASLAEDEKARAFAETVASQTPVLSQRLVAALGKNADAGRFADYLLVSGTRHGRNALVVLALRHGADVNFDDGGPSRPLAIAMQSGEQRSVSVLVSAGADPASAGVDPSLLERMAGDALRDRRMLALLERAHAIDARDAEGRTLLFLAAELGREFLVAALLAQHADPGAVAGRQNGGGEGWTPLMIAAAGGHDEVVRELTGAGAAVDQRNARGRTALMWSVLYARDASTAALLAAGADPDATDVLGLTPRTLAPQVGDQAATSLLQNVPRRARPAEGAPAGGASR
ncbi:MAG TPA: ankyrin repeat domain-containing protein [Candidatus Binatia bacterium]